MTPEAKARTIIDQKLGVAGSLNKWRKPWPTGVSQKMNDYRRQQIHAKALELLESAGVTALSVDPIKIAEHLDIAVHAKPAHVEGASGWLIKSGKTSALLTLPTLQTKGFNDLALPMSSGITG